MAEQLIYATHDCRLDQVHPDVNDDTYVTVGQLFAGSTKTYNWRSVLCFDVSGLAGWTITTVEWVGYVFSINGPQFACTLRRVTEAFNETQATYNNRLTATAWATAGADTPNSATDTNKIAFNSPTLADQYQNVVTGLKTLVDDAIANRGGLLWFHVRSDNEYTSVSTAFGVGAGESGYPNYLRVTGTTASQIKKVSGVALASIKQIAGVPIASVKKISGVANT